MPERNPDKNKKLADRLAERTTVGISKRITSNAKISSYNKGRIQEMCSWLGSNDSNVKTVQKYMYCMERFLKVMEEEKMSQVDFDKIDKEQMQRLISRVNKSDYSDWVKTMIKTVIKTVWKHWYGQDVQHPIVTAGIKISRPENKLKNSDLLSESEVISLIRACRNDRDRSIISLSYGLALRDCETEIKVRDVHLKEGYITIDSEKTGIRKAYLSSFETPYLITLLNNNSEKKPDDYLWTDWLGNRLSTDAIRMIVKRAGRDSGVSKRKKVWFYLLRHSRITSWVNRKVPIAAIKKQVGHTARSTMIEATYTHLADDDVRAHILQGNRDELPDETKEEAPRLKAQICPWCSKKHEASAIFCPETGRPISLELAQAEEKSINIAKSDIAAAMTSEQKMKELGEYVIEQNKKVKKVVVEKQ
jgi:site-specific recombinase XerD